MGAHPAIIGPSRPAFPIAAKALPDLILLDVIMPSMDGGDIAAHMKNDRHLRDVPVIFLTATVSQREAGDGGLNSGGALFLAKPVSVENLIKCINENTRKSPSKPDEKSKAEPAA